MSVLVYISHCRIYVKRAHKQTELTWLKFAEFTAEWNHSEKRGNVSCWRCKCLKKKEKEKSRSSFSYLKFFFFFKKGNSLLSSWFHFMKTSHREARLSHFDALSEFNNLQEKLSALTSIRSSIYSQEYVVNVPAFKNCWLMCIIVCLISLNIVLSFLSQF